MRPEPVETSAGTRQQVSEGAYQYNHTRLHLGERKQELPHCAGAPEANFLMSQW